MFFKCKHPFDSLITEKQATIEKIDVDFSRQWVYFKCMKCGASLKSGVTLLNGGVDEFLKRGGVTP